MDDDATSPSSGIATPQEKNESPSSGEATAQEENDSPSSGEATLQEENESPLMGEATPQEDNESPMSGVATPKKDIEMNLYIMERFNRDATLDESGEESTSEKGGFVSCVSITNRWRMRVLKLKQLKSVIQEWRQQEEPGIINFKHIAEVKFAVKCSTSRNDECTRTLCKSFTTMKKSCEIFLENKKLQTDDEKELAKAKRLHAEVESVQSDSRMKLAKAHSEHADAATKLPVVKPERELTEAQTALADAQRALVEAQTELAEAQTELAEALRALAETQRKLAEAPRELAEAPRELAEAENCSSSPHYRKLERLVSMAAARLVEAKRLVDMVAERVDTRTKLVDTLAKLVDQQAEIVDTRAELVDTRAKLVDTRAKLVDTRAELVDRNAVVVDRNAVVVDSKADLVGRDADAILAVAGKIFMGHDHVKSLLGAFRIAGNDASVLSALSSKTASLSKEDSQLGAGDGVTVLPATETSVTSNSTNRNSNRLDADQSSPSKLDTLSSPSPTDFHINADFLPALEPSDSKKLLKFYKYLKRGFGKATILNGTLKERRQRVEETVNAIIDYKVDKPLTQSATTFYAPSCESHEKDEVQPLMYAILVRMTQLIADENHITREQGIPKLADRKPRVVDFVVNALKEYFAAILPAILGVPIEVKPITRKNKTVDKLLLDAQNQLIGHLAKQAMFALEHGGIGSDQRFFGLELTMGSVAVIVLELKGVGTAEVQVTTRRSKRAPLFDKDIREHLFGEMMGEVESSLENLVDELRMPPGFCLLARTLMSVERDADSLLFEDKEGFHGNSTLRLGLPQDAAPFRLGQYLGSGAFSHVVKLNIEGRNDVFAKVPRSYRMRRSLVCEAEGLNELRGHACIPQPYDPNDPVKTLDIHFRCEISSIACLPLVGLIGQPTCKQSFLSDNKKLKTIFENVYGAIKYAHGKHWAHLDVRPSNIITSFNLTNCSLQVMLIDWGCAHRNDQDLKGFFGCPPYAHEELFGLKKNWRPDLKHDLASLAYTVAHLCHDTITWTGFANHHAVTDDVRMKRHDSAMKAWTPLFDEWHLSSQDKTDILEAISYQKSKPRERKRAESANNHPVRGPSKRKRSATSPSTRRKR